MRPTVGLSERWELVAERGSAIAAARRAGLPEDALRFQPLNEVDLNNARQLDLKDAWLECPIGADWICAYRLIAQEGVPVVAEVRVFPNEPGRAQKGEWSARWLGHRAPAPKGGITARLLREVKVGEHLRVADMIFDNFERQAPGELARAGFTAPEGARRRGPKGLPDSFYAEVARDYVAACSAGSKSPAADVAARRRGVTKGGIRRILHEARRRRLLDGTPRRRSGGKLTDTAKSLLETVPEIVPAATRNQPQTTQRQPTSKRKTR